MAIYTIPILLSHRVTGETASSRDMHRRISQNFERYFAKRRWRVSRKPGLAGLSGWSSQLIFPFFSFFLLNFPHPRAITKQLAFNAQRTLNRLRVFSSGKKGQASPQRSDGAATPPPQADSKPGLTQMLPSMNITEE